MPADLFRRLMVQSHRFGPQLHGCDQVGIRDDVWADGGSSALSMTMSTRSRNRSFVFPSAETSVTAVKVLGDLLRQWPCMGGNPVRPMQWIKVAKVATFIPPQPNAVRSHPMDSVSADPTPLPTGDECGISRAPARA